MVLTHSFKETVQERVKRDPQFRKELLRGAFECMLEGDIDTGKLILRDYINATIGFEKLGKAVETSPKSLMRMFSPKGNPQTKNLFTVLHHLQKHGKFRLELFVRE